MSRILNLPYTRFVCQVSNGGTRSKSSFLSMMAENEKYLQNCEWHESEAEANEVAIPVNNVFLPEGYINDAYDAYIRGGRANVNGADTFEGYAGMVAYRFKLPEAYKAEGSEAMIESLSLIVSRDRYLRAGVRVVAVVSDADSPSKEWSVVRGEDSPFGTSSIIPQSQTLGLRSKGFLNQAETEYLVDTRAEEQMLTVDLTGIDATKHSYVYVYLTLEDYQNRWIWHSQNQRREYWIEGAAMLVGQSNSFTFSADVSPDSNSTLEPSTQGGVSPTFMQPQILARTTAGQVTINMPEEDTEEHISDYSAGFKNKNGFYSGFSDMELLGDMSYQVAGANVRDGLRSPKEVFESLVAMSEQVGGIGSNYVANGKAMPLGETDKLTITPKFLRSFDSVQGQSTAQPGLSIWFKASDETSIQDENLLDADGNIIAQRCVNMPSFLQVSAYSFIANHGGKHIILQSAESVANTGIRFKIAAYKITRSAVMGRLGFYAVPALLMKEGVARCTTIGTEFTIQSDEVGTFTASLCGLSSEILGEIQANGQIVIDVDGKVNNDDVIVLLPIPMSVNPEFDSPRSCYFGRQTNPDGGEDVDTYDYSWARLPTNLGWFPQVTIA